MRRGALRGAFIGFGNVALKGHLPGWRLRNDVTIAAATDIIAARREAFLAACPGARWYETVDDLLASETLDFVDICTPPGTHGELIAEALMARLHVLCEKPLVTRAGDALAVAAAAASADRVVHTVHNWLKAPICLRIAALLDADAIGAVRSVQWRTFRTQPAVSVEFDGTGNWRIDPAMAGGGVLLDHGWHSLYCIMRWVGHAPWGVTASLESRRFHQWSVEDTATLTLHLGTSTANIHLTWAADERSNHIELEGEHGRIKVISDTVVIKSLSGERRWLCPPPLSEGSHHPGWFAGVAEDFCSAAGSRTKGNLSEAVLCARLIDLAQRSSAAGGPRLLLGA
jgi:predicted dehydrogenase